MAAWVQKQWQKQLVLEQLEQQSGLADGQFGQVVGPISKIPGLVAPLEVQLSWGEQRWWWGELQSLAPKWFLVEEMPWLRPSTKRQNMVVLDEPGRWAHQAQTSP